jgi:hypothetical protein
METAFLVLIAVVLGGAVAGGLASTWTLHRRTRSLEYAVSDLEDRMLTVKNREKAEKRWDKQRSIEEELQAITAGAPARTPRRYANDPVEPMD